MHTAPLKLAVPLPLSAGPEMVKAIDSEMLAVPNPSINVPPTAFPCCASVVVADCAPPTGSFVAPMYSPETTSVEADGKAVEPPEHPTRASPAVAHNAQNLTGKQAISKHLPHPLSELNSRELRPHSRADGRSRAILFSARVASLPVRPPTFRQDVLPRSTPFAVPRDEYFSIVPEHALCGSAVPEFVGYKKDEKAMLSRLPFSSRGRG